MAEDIITFEDNQALLWKQPPTQEQEQDQDLIVFTESSSHKQPTTQKKDLTNIIPSGYNIIDDINYKEKDFYSTNSYNESDDLNYEEKAFSIKSYNESDDINIDYEEEKALLWRQPTQPIQEENFDVANYNRNNYMGEERDYYNQDNNLEGSYKDDAHSEDENEDEEENIEYMDQAKPPDKTWLISSRLNLVELLGEQNSNLKRVQELTSTRMNYNKKDNSIEIWGLNAKEALEKWNEHAYRMYNRIKSENFENEKVPSEKAPSEKALSEKAPSEKAYSEKASSERDNIQEPCMVNEENAYKGRPRELTQFSFNSYFVFPDNDIHISRIIGEKDSVLDPVRSETKCYIWHDLTLPGNTTIRIVGNSFESVEEAALRVKNLYIKASMSNSISSYIFHMVEPPHKPCRVRIADPPPEFKLPYGVAEAKLFEKVISDDDDVNDTLHEIRESNVKVIEDELLKAFETIHLFDEEIKMRIRFGHVCFTHVFKNFENGSLSVDELENVLKDDRTKSKFSTCLATEHDQLKNLFEILSKHNLEVKGSPYREIKIHATHKFSKSKSKDLFPCAYNIRLDEHEKIELSSAVICERSILDINMLNLDNYSWSLEIQKAKRLPVQPQYNFIDQLKICSQGRLIYSNTKETKVISVCEKTKWKYLWNEDYIIEITKYEFWEELPELGPDTKIYLSQRLDTTKVSYGVTLCKKSWDDNLALNRDLKVGEAPEWHPRDMIDEEETGGVNDLLSNIQNFLKLLQDNLPILE